MFTHVRRTVRRLSLTPLGVFAFAIVGGAIDQAHAAGLTIPLPTVIAQTTVSDDMVVRLVTQGGAVAVLIVVLWSYRRDFFRKLEDKDRELRERRDEKDTLQEVLEKSTAASTSSVIATTNQTAATHRLARTVENIERKMDERRRMDGGA